MSQGAHSAARREFVRAWYDWQRVPLPVDSFRQNRIRSATLGLEHELDHLRSSVYGTGTGFLGGATFDWPRIVTSHLDDLAVAETELAGLVLPHARKQPYQEFVAATRRMLTALLTAAEGIAAADDTPG